jgi:saccharopine dehydrogenase-like NADP-dependent oxidoreductase
VIEEYTRPARQVEHGQVVVRPALSSPELVEFDGVGTLEAFDTDGLRSLIKTLRVPHMLEKTLRYPGHIELMRVLRDTGFFSQRPIDIGGQKVRPLDVTSALLFPKWTFGEGEADLTVLRVIAIGKKDGVHTRLRYDLWDRYDPKTKMRSMSRTTAFPAAIFARLLADGKFGPGVHPPETLATQPGIFEHVMGELNRRGIHTSFTSHSV